MSEKELRELDAWIAENLFGMRRTNEPDDLTTDGANLFWHRKEEGKEEVVLSGKAYPLRGPVEKFSHSWIKFQPTADPAAAMMVLERCGCETAAIIIFPQSEKWFVGTNDINIDPGLGAQAKTLPLAICLFAKILFAN